MNSRLNFVRTFATTSLVVICLFESIAVQLVGSHTAEATQAKPTETIPRKLKLVIIWDSPSTRKPTDLINNVKATAINRLQSAGYSVVPSESNDYGFLIRLKYTVTGFGDVGYELSLIEKTGKALVLDKGLTVVSQGNLYDFPYIAPLTISAITSDPAPLISLLEGDYLGARTAAPSMLGRYPQRKVIEALVRAMGSDSTTASNSAYALASIIGQNNDQALRTPVLSVVHDRAWVQTVSAVDKFIYPLGFRDTASRRGAAWILGELGDERAIPKLTTLVEGDPDASVRAVAKAALNKIRKSQK